MYKKEHSQGIKTAEELSEFFALMLEVAEAREILMLNLFSGRRELGIGLF